jgi:DNA-binding GntR family transcriptional regulator
VEKKRSGRLRIPKLKKDKRTLQMMVYQHIRKEIMRGALKWGEKLSEESLARSFNVSRTPVREAIFQLVQEGLVIKQPHNCFYVRHFTEKEIEEIYFLRSILEPAVLELVIGKVDDNLINELEDNLNRSQLFLQKGNMEQVFPLISDFHEIIYRYAGSPKLQEILRGLGGDMLLTRFLAVQKKGVLEDFIDHHRQLVDALKAKNRPVLEQIMRDHLEEGRLCAIEVLAMESRTNKEESA